MEIFERIMRQSLGTAFFARELGRFLEMPDRASTYTLGLLHATGKLVLLYNRPNDYEALWCIQPSGGCPTLREEHAIFGTDHAVIGALCIKRWNLPAVMAVAIRHYASPQQVEDSQERTFTLVLALSIIAAQQLLTSSPTPIEAGATLRTLAEITEVSADELRAYLDSLQRQADRYVAAMHG